MTKLNGQIWEFTEFVCYVSTLFVVCIYRLFHRPTQNAASVATESHDTAWLVTVASQSWWRHRYSLCVSLTKPDVAPPVLHQTASKPLQGRIEEPVFVCFTVTIVKQSVMVSQSPVQWRNPLRMECTARFVCLCLPHDTFETFSSSSTQVRRLIHPISLSHCLRTCTCAPAPPSISPPPSSACIGPHRHPELKVCHSKLLLTTSSLDVLSICWLSFFAKKLSAVLRSTLTSYETTSSDKSALNFSLPMKASETWGKKKRETDFLTSPSHLWIQWRAWVAPHNVLSA